MIYSNDYIIRICYVCYLKIYIYTSQLQKKCWISKVMSSLVNRGFGDVLQFAVNSLTDYRKATPKQIDTIYIYNVYNPGNTFSMFYLFWGYHFCRWCSMVQSWETTENDGWGPATYEYPTAHIGGVEDPQGFHDF